MPRLILEQNSHFFERSRYTFSSQEKYPVHFIFILTGILLYIGILIFRSWENFSHPGFYAEDSIHYFNFFYGNAKSAADIFQHPNGYYNIYNNLVALLIAKADILHQALFYQLASTTLSVITVCAFSFSGLITNRVLLVISPLVLGLSGMNHVYYYLSLTFQMYIVVLLLLTLLLYRRITSAYGSLLLFILLSFLIWSGPYSVLAVPFCLTFLCFFKGRSLLFTGLIFVTIAYTLSVTKSTIMLENLFNIDILQLWLHTLVTDVYFMGFKDSVNPEKLLLIAFSLGLLFFYLRKDTFYIKTAALFGVIIIASFAPLFLSKKYLLYQAVFPCHKLIAQYFWLAFLMFSADRILRRMAHHKNFAIAVVAGSLIVFVAWDNVLHDEKYKAPILTTVPSFLRTVKELEESGLAERHEKVVVSTQGTGRFFLMAIVGDQSKKSTLVSKIRVE